MKTTPSDLLERIYEYAKQNGILIDYKIHLQDEWEYKLDNGVTIKAVMLDEGYCHQICVSGLVNAYKVYHNKDNRYFYGDANGLLTVARMIGFQVDY